MRQPKVLVLISHITEFRLDNYSIIPNALRRADCEVIVGDIETLGYDRGRFVCRCATITDACRQGEAFPAEALRVQAIDHVDLVWSLASPHPATYLETFQLLWALHQQAPFVNSPEAVLFLNNKITLISSIPTDHLPETVIFNDYETLRQTVEQERDDSWVLKPPNEGCGAGVYLLNGKIPNTRALIQDATGNTVANYERYGRQTIGLSKSYAVLQRYVPNVTENEKRVLIAGGEPICGFRRFHHELDHRANVTLGNQFEGLSLTTEESSFCRTLGARLMDMGLMYVGLDLAFPYVLELNLVNPGALNYSYKATGVDKSGDVIRSIFAALKRRGLLSDVSAESTSNDALAEASSLSP